MKSDVSYIRVYFYDLGSNFTLTQMTCPNLYTDLRATKSTKMQTMEIQFNMHLTQHFKDVFQVI